MELDVLVSNHNTLKFYDRLGFPATHRFVDAVAGVPLPLVYLRWVRAGV